ncbi:hypothetical protein DH2020_034694 [Rehmannia glutinosa]|uniref:Uncharacterized protein n=1 Tax=Rehmannia glutinosa TaxID=99300 RepID=A0ABR0VBG3_REHGL
MDQRLTTKKLPPPAKLPASAAGSLVHRSSHLATGSRSMRYHRYEVAARGMNVGSVFPNRRQPASKEIVRRALTPPSQKPSWRWRNFTPTPSRFFNMSMA